MHPLDHVRRLILTRAKEKRLSLADLSRGVDKNPAYVHQYIHKGSPRVLPEDVRRGLARMLELDDAELHHNPVPRREPAAALDLPGSRDLPVFSDSAPLNREAVSELIDRPALFAGMPLAFALWISRPGGRLVTGDLAYVHPHKPPRPGDTVIAVPAADAVPVAGVLVSLDGSAAEIGLADSVLRLAGAAVYKVVGALFA